jgi:hypothetical protein
MRVLDKTHEVFLPIAQILSPTHLEFLMSLRSVEGVKVYFIAVLASALDFAE